MRFHQEITMGRMLTLLGAQWVKEKKRHSTMFFFFQPVFGMGVPIHSRNIFF